VDVAVLAAVEADGAAGDVVSGAVEDAAIGLVRDGKVNETTRRIVPGRRGTTSGEMRGRTFWSSSTARPTRLAGSCTKRC